MVSVTPSTGFNPLDHAGPVFPQQPELSNGWDGSLGPLPVCPWIMLDCLQCTYVMAAPCPHVPAGRTITSQPLFSTVPAAAPEPKQTKQPKLRDITSTNAIPPHAPPCRKASNAILGVVRIVFSFVPPCGHRFFLSFS